MTQASLAKTSPEGCRPSVSADGTLSLPHSTHNFPSHFPPLKLGDSEEAPVFLFPHVSNYGVSDRSARKLLPGEEITDFHHSSEAASRRNSWSYFIGRNGHRGDHPTEDMNGGTDTKSKADLSEIGTRDLSPKTQEESIRPYDDPRCPRHQRLQKVDEVQQASLETCPVSLHTTNTMSSIPAASTQYTHIPQMASDPQTQDPCPGNVLNPRSYSLKLSSHPPFHPPQSSSLLEFQKRGLLAQQIDTAGNGHSFHRVKSAPPIPGAQLSTGHSLRRRPSSTTGMKECKKLLLRPSLGRPTHNLHQYSTTNRNLKPLLLSNSYQPPQNLVSTPRRYSTTSINSSRSINYSHSRAYPDPPNFPKRSTKSSTGHNDTNYEDINSSTMVLKGHEGIPVVDYGTHGGVARIRSLSEGSREVAIRDFRSHFARTRGEIVQTSGGTQFNEYAFIERRPSVQSQSTSRGNFFIPDELCASPIRSSSYRSTIEPTNRTDPRTYGSQIVPLISSRMGLDGEVYDHLLTTTNIGYTSSNIQGFSMEGPIGKRRVDDFGYLTTLDATSRPYTPDNFVANVGTESHTRSATRNPSNRSARSLGSTGQHNRRQSGGSIGSSHTIFSSSSASHTPNVLRKHKPSYKDTSMCVSHDSNRSSSPASTTATIGLGIIGAFKERRKLSQELKAAVEHPHTATTHAGPTRGSISEDTPSQILQDVYQPETTQSRLNSMAREGKARYDAITREIKQLITAENELEKQREIDSSSHRSSVQDTIDLRRHKKSRNQSNTTSGNISQPAMMRTTTMSQTTETGAVKVKSPTSNSEQAYVSTVYNEGQRIVERLWERGIGIPFANFKSKRDARRALRYGASGKKIKVYMRGARGGSLTVFEKIGRKVGIDNPVGGWGKSKVPTNFGDIEHDATVVDKNRNDPLGINLSGAVDITEGRVGVNYLDGHSEGGFGISNELWDDFDLGKLVDPVKEKLEGDNSGRYWSSKKEVELESTFWSKLRRFITKKPSKSQNSKIHGEKPGGI